MASKKPAAAATRDALSNWSTCNEFLREASETQAKELLSKEQRGKRRVQYLLRIHARYNRERAKRERAELLSKTA